MAAANALSRWTTSVHVRHVSGFHLMVVSADGVVVADIVETKKPYRILSLDGGGAKGFYTLGVLAEIEGLIGCRLCENSTWCLGRAPAP